MVTVECSHYLTLDVGDDIVCICTGPGGNPPARVTWFKGNKQKSGTGKKPQILRITNCKKDDSGTYKCIAESHEEAKNETTIKLVVNCKYIDSGIRLSVLHVRCIACISKSSVWSMSFFITFMQWCMAMAAPYLKVSFLILFTACIHVYPDQRVYIFTCNWCCFHKRLNIIICLADFS